jgi:lipopolysaccharide transport system permease protein
MDQYIRHGGTHRTRLRRYVAEVWGYRHLIWSLVLSDLQSRYRRSVLGLAWAVLQPIILSALLAYVFSLFFGQPFKPFFIFVLTGFVIWDAVVMSITAGLTALENAGGFLMQARIPLLVFQLRIALGAIINFGFGLIAVAFGAISVGSLPETVLPLLMIFPYALLLLLLLTPLTIVFSILGIRYRDANHIVPIALQLVFLTAPIIIPREAFEQPQLAMIQYLNPVVPLLDVFRAPILHGEWAKVDDLLLVLLWGLGLWTIALISARLSTRRIMFYI